MSVAQDKLNLGGGPPPLATPITAQGPDEFGVPHQSRGLPSGNLNIGWAGWFNGIWNRMVVLLDAVLGYSNLTHVGAVPKVSAAGTLSESAITDTGTKVTVSEQVAIDGLAAPPVASQLSITANGAGALELLSYAVDNEQVLLDCTFTAAVGVVAASTTIARLIKGAGVLYIKGAVGQTVGNALAGETYPFWIDLANLRCGFGGNVAPAHTIDATGDANVSGVYRVAGTQVVGPRGAALTATGASVSGVAGATYTATERAMLNDLEALANRLKVTVDQIQSRLQAHGLIT